MVYPWGLFLVKKCNGVSLEVISGKKCNRVTLLTKIWPEKYCFVIEVLLTAHIAIQWAQTPLEGPKGP